MFSQINDIQLRLDEFKPLPSVLDYGVLRLFLRYPLRFLYFGYLKKLARKAYADGKLMRVGVFAKDSMYIMLPASLDIYFFGLKSHPSEIALARYLTNVLHHGDSFLDIGAHFGYFTILASTLVGKKGKVLSIEASPETFKVLQRNAKGRDNVEIRNIAVSDHDGDSISFFVFSVYNSELNTLNPKQYEQSAWYAKNTGREVQVATASLNTLANTLPRAPQVIKIDVEGAEDMVVASGLDYLSTHRQSVLIMEYVNDQKDPAPYLTAEERLKSIGYRPHYISLQGTLSPIDGVTLDFMKERKLISENIAFLSAQ